MHNSTCLNHLLNIFDTTASSAKKFQVFCVYAGKGVPNTRITCWECSSTVCSVLGLRIHMVVEHGIFMRVEEEIAETKG